MGCRRRSPCRREISNELPLGRTNQNNTCRFGVFWQVAASGERAQWLGEKMSCYMASSGGQPASRTVAGQPSRPWRFQSTGKTEALPPEMRHKSGHGGSAVFLSAEFVNALIEKREPTVRSLRIHRHDGTRHRGAPVGATRRRADRRAELRQGMTEHADGAATEHSTSVAVTDPGSATATGRAGAG